jgi:UDP-xylose:glucoside alpha-1,3-xylosyltransferase
MFNNEAAMHIVYAVCGNEVKPDFFMSLKSLHLFGLSGLSRMPAYYHIHVLTDGAIKEDDVVFLTPKSNFKVTLHDTCPEAITLFKNCSTERIYLHQHKDFQDLDKVGVATANQL